MSSRTRHGAENEMGPRPKRSTTTLPSSIGTSEASTRSPLRACIRHARRSLAAVSRLVARSVPAHAIGVYPSGAREGTTTGHVTGSCRSTDAAASLNRPMRMTHYVGAEHPWTPVDIRQEWGGGGGRWLRSPPLLAPLSSLRDGGGCGQRNGSAFRGAM